MQYALVWEGWRKIRVHYGRTDEPPSCILLIEPISEEQPMLMNPGLKGGLRKVANPVIEPDNPDDDVPDDLKAASYGEYNYL
jgi:hypothetical protein